MSLLHSILKPIVKKRIKGLEFRVGKKAGSNPKNAIVYFPRRRFTPLAAPVQKLRKKII